MWYFLHIIKYRIVHIEIAKGGESTGDIPCPIRAALPERRRRKKMGRHPFKEYAEKYMESVRGVYAEETWKNRARRYNRMNNKLIELKEAGRISTTSPKSMTPEDVRVYILHCKEKQSTADLVHEVNALRKILNFADNHAVEICLNHNPGLKPMFKGNRRKDVMSDEVYDLILERSKVIDPTDFNLVRAYTLVLMCINTGTRNKEIRFSEVRDLDTTSWLFDIVHVKGEDSYGQPREVPIPPEIRQLILTYLLARQKWVVDNSVKSQALFPSKDSADGFLSGNAIRKIKEVVEEDLGIDFDLRECRRTFGQRYLDSDLDIESVSVLMGHASTKTTESFYSRKRLTKAVESAKRTWKDSGGQ